MESDVICVTEEIVFIVTIAKIAQEVVVFEFDQNRTTAPRDAGDEKMSYTWKCLGCGKTGKNPLTYEKADFGGDNHWRGLAGNLKDSDKCVASGHIVVPFVAKPKASTIAMSHIEGDKR